MRQRKSRSYESDRKRQIRVKREEDRAKTETEIGEDREITAKPEAES